MKKELTTGVLINVLVSLPFYNKKRGKVRQLAHSVPFNSCPTVWADSYGFGEFC